MQVLHFVHPVVYCCVCTGWRVVSGGGDAVIKVWDLETGNVTATLQGHTQEVVSCDMVAAFHNLDSHWHLQVLQSNMLFLELNLLDWLF